MNSGLVTRPVLEYADVVWDPHTKTNIIKVEIIQNRAVRFISNLKGQLDSVFYAKKTVKSGFPGEETDGRINVLLVNKDPSE